MFKLMRSMFPKVMTNHFKMKFFNVKSVEIDQEKCLARIEFIPNGLMYSTPQKRCCIREYDENDKTGFLKVLDCKNVVQRCLDHESRAYIRNRPLSNRYRLVFVRVDSIESANREINRLKRVLELIKTTKIEESTEDNQKTD